MTLDEFLTLTLPERIRWLRSASGPQGELSHDKFAALFGTTRQTVIGWEKRGVEPKRYAGKLAAFSGFPSSAFRRREAETLARADPFAQMRARLEELAADVRALLEASADHETRLARLESELARRPARSRRPTERPA